MGRVFVSFLKRFLRYFRKWHPALHLIQLLQLLSFLGLHGKYDEAPSSFFGFRAPFFLRERRLSSPFSNAAIPGHFLPRECPVMIRGSLVPFLPQASVRLFGDLAPGDNHPLRCWWDTSSPLASPPLSHPLAGCGSPCLQPLLPPPWPFQRVYI